MLLDSFAHAEDDVKARLLTEQRVEAERIASAARAAMADSSELLTNDDKKAIAAAMAELDRVKAGTDHNAIRAAVEQLDVASKEFAGRRMNRALEAGLRGRGVTEVEAKVAETEPKQDLESRMSGSGHGHSHSGHSHR
jgi:molecular chaperone HscA